MAYTTPTYDYGKAQSDLTLNKGLQDQAGDYGRFLGQERHRRGLEDTTRNFKQSFPKVAQSYQNRGFYHSGVRKQGQQQYGEGFQRDVSRQNYDWAGQETGFAQAQAIRDAQYQAALRDLFERMQAMRAQDDPFAQIGGL